MIDTLTDTLMALWNTTWKGKILPGLIAFIIVGICMSLFFLLIKLPAFSHQQPTTLNRSAKSASLAISPHNGDIHATVVPTPTPALVPTPTPMQADDAPVPAPAPVPLPMQLPGITSDPNVASAINTDIGNTDINSYAPLPAPTNAIAHTSIRHKQPTAKPVSAPPVIPTATPTPPAATAMAIPANNTPPSTTSVTPTVVATPTPTSVIVATPTTIVPTANPAPTPTYPATSTSGSSPTASATATLAPAVTATPTANTASVTVTVVTKNSPA